MKFLDKMERKLGKYAIHNLMNYIIVLYVVGLILSYFMPGVYNAYFSLNRQRYWKKSDVYLLSLFNLQIQT